MRRLLIAFAFAVAGTASLAQDSLLEPLTRREQLLGWEAIGRVDVAGTGFCTGTLIAPDLVLTAAHCVVGADGPLDAGKITFRAGYSGGQSIAERAVARFVVHESYDPAGQKIDAIAHDLAILQLADPILAAVAAPFAVTVPNEGREVSILSYAERREDVLSWQRLCRVKARGQGLMVFSCDVSFGSSGAPVFDRSGQRARIVSIISSGTRDGDGVISVGPELPGLLADLKAALRSGRGVISTPAPQAELAQRRQKPGLLGAGMSGGAKFVKP